MRCTSVFLKKARIYYPKKTCPKKFLDRHNSRGKDFFPYYKSKDPGCYIQAAEQEDELLSLQRKTRELDNQGVSWEKYSALKYGCVAENNSQRCVQSELDSINTESRPMANMEYRRKRNKEYLRALIHRIKSIRTPGYDMYKKTQNELFRERKEIERIHYYRNLLESETAITPEQRIDAYFLGDESLFPAWARGLGEAIRDRVLYDGIGLTEYDEVRRAKLLTLPMTIRKARWNRIKQYRRVCEGTETLITDDEKKSVIRCIPKYKRNLISRLERQIRIRIVEARSPSATKLQVKMEERTGPLRTIAKYVHCGLPTCGAASLDDERATKRLQLIEEDERLGAFVRNSRLLQGNIDQRVKSRLQSHVNMWCPSHLKERPVKRISRKCYKHRWSAILAGSRDEHGRRIVDEKRVFPKYDSHKSFLEFAIERDELGMPLPHSRPPIGKANEPWPAQYKYQNSTLTVGLPKPNEGWY